MKWQDTEGELEDDELNHLLKVDKAWRKLRKMEAKLESMFEQMISRYEAFDACSPDQRTCPCGKTLSPIINLIEGGYTFCSKCGEKVCFDEDNGELEYYFSRPR
jgi:hypothetical protein